MYKIEELTNELSRIQKRHDSFKKLFNEFQENINHLFENAFPVKGITLIESTDTNSTIEFIGRTYELTFSTCMIDTVLKGKITACRVTGEGESSEIANITYNGQSQVDVQPPQGEDAIMLNEDSCCLNLVLNWFYSDISA